MNFEDKKGQGATEYLLMLAAVLVVVASAVYYVTQVGNYPAVGVTATVDQPDNIWLSHATGSVPAGEWEVEITPTTDLTAAGYFDGSLSDGATGNVVLDNDVRLAQYTGTGAQTFDVILRHVGSGHTYIDTTVTCEG